MKSTNDAVIFDALAHEERRQQEGLELIPSENYPSDAVRQAVASVAMNKYAEGQVGARYYGGCDYVDVVEQTARDRACALFGAEHANVQPHSGAPANLAAYSALLQPNDVVLGMELSHGGHLTHGHPATLAAKLYRFFSYGTTIDGSVDYDQMERLAHEHKPKLILVGYSSYTHDLDYERVAAIAKSVGARCMADVSHIAGLIAAKRFAQPFPHMDVVTTTTHKTLRGPRGGLILCKQELASVIDKAVFPGLQGGPHMNAIAGVAVALHEAAQPEFVAYIDRVLANAQALAHALEALGYRLCFGGTDNHLILIDLSNTSVLGVDAQRRLDACGITTNKNVIPNDPHGAKNPSGLRLGTPAISTRGLTPSDMPRIADWMHAGMTTDDASVHERIRTEVRAFMSSYPLVA